MKKKLGVIVQYYDFRNDVRRLIAELGERYEVVIFGKAEDAQHIDGRYEFREIKAAKRSARNRLWNAAYLLFGNLPGSKESYYRWRRRNLDSERGGSKVRQQRAILELAVRLPELIDFDTYVQHLDFSPQTRIDDVDLFLGFTDTRDPHFSAHLRSEGKKIVTYVYSWDHAGKYHKFSRAHDTYLTWNSSVKDDLIQLQGIKPDHIEAVGSSQFAYIQEYLDRHADVMPRPFDFEYVYFGAAAGYLKVTAQEVQVIEMVSKALSEVAPDVKLVVRPYPLAANWAYYDPLKKLANVVFDDYREQGTGKALTEDRIFEKFNKIQHARAFVHIGSTMGVEASYFDTPVLHLDLQDVDFGLAEEDASYIGHFIHAYHGEKYMLLTDYPNVITKANALPEVLETALTEPERLFAYNRALSARTELRSVSTFTDRLEGVLENLLSGSAARYALLEAAD